MSCLQMKMLVYQRSFGNLSPSLAGCTAAGIFIHLFIQSKNLLRNQNPHTLLMGMENGAAAL